MMFDDRCNGVRDDSWVLVPIIFPVFLKDAKQGEGETPIQALKDTGNFSLLVVNKDLIPESAMRHDKSVSCRGIFRDGKSQCFPTSLIQIIPQASFRLEVRILRTNIT